MAGTWFHNNSNPPVRPGFYGTITTKQIIVAMAPAEYLAHLKGFIKGAEFTLPVLGECLDWIVSADADCAAKSIFNGDRLNIIFDRHPLSLNDGTKIIHVETRSNQEASEFLSSVFQIVEGAAYGE